MVAPVLDWYAENGRDLPWRASDVGAWGVLVCEVMSHQTPVARVLPAWQAWLRRWPQPADLARDSPGEAVRMWDRLGYPRRALRLHEAAVAITEEHGGVVPAGHDELLRLPGVGPYTAAATAAFASGARTVVLDVNVRRVLARVHEAAATLSGAPTRAEVERARDLLPGDPARSVRWNAAVMELGALVCRARRPLCGQCPLQDRCAWRSSAAAATGAVPARTTRPQAWVGTDRYVRGLLLTVLRAAPGTVPAEHLETEWHDSVQVGRCLTGLLEDGLAEAVTGGYRLPG